MYNGKADQHMNQPDPAAAAPGAAVRPPSTADYIAFHAAQRPDAIAVIDGARRVTWDRFHNDLRRVTHALRGFGLAPGRFAAVEWTTLYAHWLLLLGFENLGVATTTYMPGNWQREPLLDLMDLVICTPDKVPEGEFRVHRLTREWLAAVLGDSPPEDAAPVARPPDAPNHVIKGSGTTGSTKLMIRTNAANEFLTAQLALNAGFTRESRYLLTLGFGISFVYRYALVCLRFGGTCISDPAIGLAAAIAKHAPTHMSLLPMALHELLDSLPADFVRPPRLTVNLEGAPVPGAVRARALAGFATELIEGYAMNETGRVCTMDTDGVGTVWPGVEVEVVDDEDRPMIGAQGRVRIRSGGCVTGYLNDPEATARMFRDGWFYPGDLGVMLGPRVLKLAGRADDMVNIRGFKLMPYAVEATLAAKLPVAEACFSTVKDAAGVTHACVALVPNPGFDMAAASACVAGLLPASFGACHIATLDALPRTPSRKIRRAALAVSLARYLRENGVAGF